MLAKYILFLFVTIFSCIIATSNELELEGYLESYIGDNRKHLAVLLDYDGTLAEITPHPNDTKMSEKMRKVLTEISLKPNIFLSVISGRAVEDVKEKVGLNNIVYSGNHGFEIQFSNGSRYNQPISEELKENFDKLINELEEKVTSVHGGWIENKKFSLTFHYRDAPKADILKLTESVSKIILKYGYRASEAHFAIEAKPPIDWNKGSAAEYILDTCFNKNWKQEKVIFAGDDTTDEDVMKTIKGHGLSFRITSNPELKTFADYKIQSVESVYQILLWINGKFNY